MLTDLDQELEDFLADQAWYICEWLRKKNTISLGDCGEVEPKVGLVAINRRSFSPGHKPFVRVHQISELKHIPKDVQGEILKAAVQQERAASAVGHFRHAGNASWGDFQGMPVEQIPETIQNALQDGRNLEDEERNTLDAAYFPEGGNILCFPVPFLGSPVVTCYLQWDKQEEDLNESARKTLESQLRQPLTAFVSTTIVASLFILGKHISDALTEHDVQHHSERFITSIACILFAKNAKAGEKSLFDAKLPLAHFKNSRQTLRLTTTETVFDITLPCYEGTETDSDVAITNDLLTRSIVELVQKVLAFLHEAASNREMLNEHSRLEETARIFNSAMPRLKDGMDNLQKALLDLNRVQSTIDRSNQSFLRLYRDAKLELLFRSKSVCYYNKNTDHGMLHEQGDPHKITLLRTIHSTSALAPYNSAEQAWTAYSDYLSHFSEKLDVHLINGAIGCSNCRNLDAKKRLKALKLILHRTHTNDLYDLAVVAHVALALDALGKKAPEIYLGSSLLETKCSNSGRQRVCLWRILTNKEIDDAGDFDWCADKTGGVKPFYLFAGDTDRSKPAITATQFLAALMQLIGTELATEAEDKVHCKSIGIKRDELGMTIHINCNNSLDHRHIELDEAAHFHGLKGCIRVLASAVDFSNGPQLLALGDYELSKVAHHSDNGWFAIATGVAQDSNGLPLAQTRIGIHLKKQPRR